jgi:hypothetical protein
MSYMCSQGLRREQVVKGRITNIAALPSIHRKAYDHQGQGGEIFVKGKARRRRSLKKSKRTKRFDFHA